MHAEYACRRLTRLIRYHKIVTSVVTFRYDTDFVASLENMKGWESEWLLVLVGEVHGICVDISIKQC